MANECPFLPFAPSIVTRTSMRDYSRPPAACPTGPPYSIPPFFRLLDVEHVSAGPGTQVQYTQDYDARSTEASAVQKRARLVTEPSPGENMEFSDMRSPPPTVSNYKSCPLATSTPLQAQAQATVIPHEPKSRAAPQTHPDTVYTVYDEEDAYCGMSEPNVTVGFPGW
ncbi:hypothetical protein EI94DRAFT_1796323 [Lactarius quietus]|nr:hypothetical protein EI94DRAFT_1796323 [Lactarius quietus]